MLVNNKKRRFGSINSNSKEHSLSFLLQPKLLHLSLCWTDSDDKSYFEQFKDPTSTFNYSYFSSLISLNLDGFSDDILTIATICLKSNRLRDLKLNFPSPETNTITNNQNTFC